LSEPWKLSTSQTAIRGEYVDPKINLDLMCAGGGFGPVADDGFGVSYIFVGDDRIFFHVSSKLSSKETDSERFAKEISKAMLDIKALFE